MKHSRSGTHGIAKGAGVYGKGLVLVDESGKRSYVYVEPEDLQRVMSWVEAYRAGTLQSSLVDDSPAPPVLGKPAACGLVAAPRRVRRRRISNDDACAPPSPTFILMVVLPPCPKGAAPLMLESTRSASWTPGVVKIQSAEFARNTGGLSNSPLRPPRPLR